MIYGSNNNIKEKNILLSKIISEKYKYICIFTVLFFIIPVYAGTFDYEICNLGWKHVKHSHSEAAYQHARCSSHSGTEEFENKDFTRVDCLTSTHAVEFDFANKWAESIGQALHYQLMTSKRAKVVLILENPKKQMVYFKRVEALAKVHGFDVEYITPKILQINNGECNYEKCKCHKTKKLTICELFKKALSQT